MATQPAFDEPLGQSRPEESILDRRPVPDIGPTENLSLPAGKSLREELMQPRYLVLAIIAAAMIALQIWVLF